MIGFKAYQMHHAINLHFKSKDYDYFKYGGKLRLNEDSFKKDRFRWQYAGFEKKFDRLLLAYYLLYKQVDFEYIRPQQLFKLASTRMTPGESLDYRYDNILLDVKHSLETILDTPETVSSIYPYEYDLYVGGSIDLETIILYDHYIKKVFTLDNSNDIVSWPSIIRKIEKIRPFVLSLISKHEFVSIIDDINRNARNKGA